MEELIGQRFSLISKSEIRYVGILHEINPEQSTIALEEVRSFGTENRSVATFVPPSHQLFEYIVFRGSDVKDIKREENSEPRQPSPTLPPNDPAILNSSRSNPRSSQQTQQRHQTREESNFLTQPPPGFPQHGLPQHYNDFYGPPPDAFGRGYGPPPPGHYPPPHVFPPRGYGPPGFSAPAQPYSQNPSAQFAQGQHQQQAPAPIGPPTQQATKGREMSSQPKPTEERLTSELSVEKQTNEREDSEKPLEGASGLLVEPVRVSLPQNEAILPLSIPTQQPVPTQTEDHIQAKNPGMKPAVPFVVNQRGFIPPSTAPVPGVATDNKALAMEKASKQAREAVAAAMAKIQPSNVPRPPATQAASIDSVARGINNLNTGAAPARVRGNYRGQRGSRLPSAEPRPKFEVPQADYDFETANAKFNKEDVIKEAIATGSPLGELSEDPLSSSTSLQNGTNRTARKDSLPLQTTPAYNKSSSFFDDLSSEAKDREDSADPRAAARAQRGVEYSKNMETFGQGNVDNNYSRGRGRGYGRGGGRGNFRANNNYRGYRGRGRGVVEVAGHD